MSPAELKRRARRSSLESLQNSLGLFYHAAIGESEALPHIIDMSRVEYIHARKNLRSETASHWRAYHKFSALCAVHTILHARKLQRLANLSESPQ